MHSEDCSLYVGVKEPVEMLLGNCAEGVELTDTRIGDYNIDSLLCSTNSLVQTIQVSHFSNVPLDANVAADPEDPNSTCRAAQQDYFSTHCSVKATGAQL